MIELTPPVKSADLRPEHLDIKMPPILVIELKPAKSPDLRPEHSDIKMPPILVIGIHLLKAADLIIRASRHKEVSKYW